MASLWLPPTIEEDEEIAVDESDSEEEERATSKARGQKSVAKKQESIFSDEFCFAEGVGGSGGAVEGGGGGWEVEEEVMEWAARKRDAVVTSLDSKILRAIEQRNLKV